MKQKKRLEFLIAFFVCNFFHCEILSILLESSNKLLSQLDEGWLIFT